MFWVVQAIADAISTSTSSSWVGGLLFNQIFEDADILGLRNLDSGRSIGVVTENETIERKKLGGIKSYDRWDLF
jgi:hypothetical protein